MDGLGSETTEVRGKSGTFLSKLAKGLGYFIWFCVLVRIMGQSTGRVSGDVGDTLGFYAGMGVALIAFASVPYLVVRYFAKKSGKPFSWTTVMLWVSLIALLLGFGGMYGRIESAKDGDFQSWQTETKSPGTVQEEYIESPIATQSSNSYSNDALVKQSEPAASIAAPNDGEIPNDLFADFVTRNTDLLSGINREQLQQLINEIDNERNRLGMRRLSDSELLEEVRSKLEQQRAVAVAVVPAPVVRDRPECSRAYNDSMNRLGDDIPVGEYARLKAEIEIERQRCFAE